MLKPGSAAAKAVAGGAPGSEMSGGRGGGRESPVRRSWVTLKKSAHPPVQPVRPPSVAPSPRAVASVLKYLPPVLAASLSDGGSPIPPETRRVCVAAFALPSCVLRACAGGPGGFDFAQSVFHMLFSTVRAAGGDVVQATADERGLRALCVWGRPKPDAAPSQPNTPTAPTSSQPRRSATSTVGGVVPADQAAALEAVSQLVLNLGVLVGGEVGGGDDDPDDVVAAGVASGLAFCGAVGGASRCEWGVVGDVVVRPALLCSRSFFLASCHPPPFSHAAPPSAAQTTAFALLSLAVDSRVQLVVDAATARPVAAASAAASGALPKWAASGEPARLRGSAAAVMLFYPPVGGCTKLGATQPAKPANKLFGAPAAPAPAAAAARVSLSRRRGESNDDGDDKAARAAAAADAPWTGDGPWHGDGGGASARGSFDGPLHEDPGVTTPAGGGDARAYGGSGSKPGFGAPSSANNPPGSARASSSVDGGSSAGGGSLGSVSTGLSSTYNYSASLWDPARMGQQQLLASQLPSAAAWEAVMDAATWAPPASARNGGGASVWGSPFYGRAAEREAIAATLADPSRRPRLLVCVTAGVSCGKSTFLRAVCADAEEGVAGAPLKVFRLKTNADEEDASGGEAAPGGAGGGDGSLTGGGGGADTPYGGWATPWMASAVSASIDSLPAKLAKHAPLLAELLPGSKHASLRRKLHTMGGERSGKPAAASKAAVAAALSSAASEEAMEKLVAHCLRTHAVPGTGILLAADDAASLDGFSLRLLASLQSHPGLAPAVAIAAGATELWPPRGRQPSAGSLGCVAAGMAASASDVLSVRLGRMDEGAVSSMAAAQLGLDGPDALPPGLGACLCRLAGDHPLFLKEVVRLLLQKGHINADPRGVSLSSHAAAAAASPQGLEGLPDVAALCTGGSDAQARAMGSGLDELDDGATDTGFSRFGEESVVSTSDARGLGGPGEEEDGEEEGEDDDALGLARLELLVQRRVDALSPAGRAALKSAACFGANGFPAALLGPAAGLNPSSFASAVRELLSEGLLEASGGGRAAPRLRFAHRAVRALVVAATPPEQLTHTFKGCLAAAQAAAAAAAAVAKAGGGAAASAPLARGGGGLPWGEMAALARGAGAHAEATSALLKGAAGTATARLVASQRAASASLGKALGRLGASVSEGDEAAVGGDAPQLAHRARSGAPPPAGWASPVREGSPTRSRHGSSGAGSDGAPPGSRASRNKSKASGGARPGSGGTSLSDSKKSGSKHMTDASGNVSAAARAAVASAGPSTGLRAEVEATLHMIEAVQASWHEVSGSQESVDRLGLRLMTSFFERKPAARRLFGFGDVTSSATPLNEPAAAAKMTRHAGALLRALGTVVDGMGDFASVEPTLHALGATHARFAFSSACGPLRCGCCVVLCFASAHTQLIPVADACCRPPVRDYMPAMKEALIDALRARLAEVKHAKVAAAAAAAAARGPKAAAPPGDGGSDDGGDGDGDGGEEEDDDETDGGGLSWAAEDAWRSTFDVVSLHMMAGLAEGEAGAAGAEEASFQATRAALAAAAAAQDAKSSGATTRGDGATRSPQELVASSWRLMEPELDVIGPVLMRAFFARAPSAFPHFRFGFGLEDPKVEPKLRQHASFLLKTLGGAVSGERAVDTHEKQLRMLGRTHARFAFSIRPYLPSMGDALQDTLAAALGLVGYKPAVAAAWKGVYDEAVGHMQTGLAEGEAAVAAEKAVSEAETRHQLAELAAQLLLHAPSGTAKA